MSNYLIRQGQAWSVKVPIPADVQHIFEKKAFKKTLKTSDKAVAIARSGPIIIQFKSEIENARGNPTAHLDDYLREIAEILMDAKRDPDTPKDAIAGLEDELRDRLLAAQGATYLEEVPDSEAASAIKHHPVNHRLDDHALGKRSHGF